MNSLIYFIGYFLSTIPLLSPIGLVAVLYSSKAHLRSGFYIICVFFSIHLVPLIIGYINEPRNAFIETIFFGFFICCFCLYESIITYQVNIILYLKRRRFFFDCILLILFIISKQIDFLFTPVYILLITIEFSKCFYYAIAFNKLKLLTIESISKVYISVFLITPFVAIAYEFFINSLNETSSVFYLGSSFLSFILVLLFVSITNTLRSFYGLKVSKFLLIFTIFIVFLSSSGLLSASILYKFSYFADSLSGVLKSVFEGKINLNSLYLVFVANRADSLAERLGEVIATIIQSPNAYYGYKIESTVLESGAILAHALIANILLKFYFYSYVSIIAVVLMLRKMKKYSKIKPQRLISLVSALPLLLLFFNNQGEFLTSIYLGSSAAYFSLYKS